MTDTSTLLKVIQLYDWNRQYPGALERVFSRIGEEEGRRFNAATARVAIGEENEEDAAIIDKCHAEMVNEIGQFLSDVRLLQDGMRTADMDTGTKFGPN